MELTITYILSQIFIIINYVFLGISYHSKDYKKILFLNMFALIFACLSYICLKAYTGLVMEMVAILRNILFIINEKKNGKSKDITKNEIYMLLFIYLITFILTIFTYNDFLSLMSVIATIIYTYSIWQRNTRVYKILGIPVSLIWIIYNIYIRSIFGIILEIFLVVVEIIGVIRERVDNNDRIKTE